MRNSIVLLLIFILTGCATEAKYSAKLDTWIGHNIQELINSWGYPDNTLQAPNGNTVYVYGYNATSYIPPTYNTTSNYNVIGNSVYGNSTTSSYGGYNIQHSCTTFIEIDSSNTIVRWQWKGNACRSD